MLELTLPRAKGRATRILCVGAHCDDIEIGCGGTLLRLLGGLGTWDVTWAVFSADEARTRELRASAQRFLKGARRTQLLAYQFTDSFFPGEYTAIKRTFATLRRLPEPDIVFTHQRGDLHQDHRLLAELTWNALPRPPAARVRDPEVRGWTHDPERARRAERCAGRRQGARAPEELPEPAGQALVPRRDLQRAHAAAGRGGGRGKRMGGRFSRCQAQRGLRAPWAATC